MTEWGGRQVHSRRMTWRGGVGSTLSHMTDASDTVSGERVRSGDDAEPSVRWIGWVLFAGLMAIMAGSVQALIGVCALLVDDWFLVGRDGLVVPLDYTVWGWLHLAVGLMFVATGYGIVSGRAWGRVTGIVLAVLSAVVNMLFVAAYPAWSLIVIGFDVMTIYALAMHGRAVMRFVSGDPAGDMQMRGAGP
jgi:hypothetical protein